MKQRQGILNHFSTQQGDIILLLLKITLTYRMFSRQREEKYTA